MHQGRSLVDDLGSSPRLRLDVDAIAVFFGSLLIAALDLLESTHHASSLISAALGGRLIPG